MSALTSSILPMPVQFYQVEKIEHYDLCYRFVLVMIFAMDLCGLRDYAIDLCAYAMLMYFECCGFKYNCNKMT
jgi:hypothetical protein